MTSKKYTKKLNKRKGTGNHRNSNRTLSCEIAFYDWLKYEGWKRMRSQRKTTCMKRMTDKRQRLQCVRCNCAIRWKDGIIFFCAEIVFASVISQQVDLEYSLCSHRINSSVEWVSRSRLLHIVYLVSTIDQRSNVRAHQYHRLRSNQFWFWESTVV